MLGGKIMFCSKCGASVRDDEWFCNKCGSRLTGNGGENTKSQTYVTSYNDYSTPVKKGRAVASMVLGIIGCVFIVFSTFGDKSLAIISFILGIIGVVLNTLAEKKDACNNAVTKAGKATTYISTILGCGEFVWFIVVLTMF